LLLKFTVPNPSHPEAPVLARHEATFYRALALDMRHLPILRCYDAVCSVPLGRCHFVLDDLTATHVAKREAAENIACLARIHAHWWEHRRFAREIGAGLTDQSIRLLVEQAQGDVAHLATGFRAVVADDDLARYRAILAFYPTLLRDQRRGPRTLVHGDAHCANFLHPLDPSADSVRLIDWEVWRIDAGTNDLAYMIARCQRHWERSFPERDLVQRYHAALEANGVEGYAWDQCWRQYRLAVMRQLLKEISIAVKRGNPEDWMRVEWATAAFDELGCAELL
jgi:thiamine kinase-like enzyme